MNFKGIVNAVAEGVKKNKTTILAVTGVIELISAGVMAFKERPEVDAVLDARREELGKKEDAQLTIKESFGPVISVMWPSFTLAVIGTSSIIFGHRMSLASNAAMTAAYQISERASENLADAVVKTVGEKKANEIFDNAAKEAVRSEDGTIHIEDDDVIPTSGGHYIFVDAESGVKFYSSTQYIQDAKNRVNHRINQEEAISVGEWLEELGIPRKRIGKSLYRIGWYMGYTGLLELHITSDIDDQGRPVGIISYNFDPRYWNE